ncbi:MAG: SRPBCC domain-containing protein [Reyranella sp.]|nr:SRPBCC domain-containing protein [Reyranella sp.]
MPDASLDANTLGITRIFDATRERVFDAWARQDQFMRWMCPPGVDMTVCEIDVRPGGAWRIDGRNSDGAFSMSGVYLEIVRPERLVFTWAHHTDGDCAGPRGHETIVRLELRALGNRTELTLIHGPFADDPSFRGHEQGWTGSFDKLDSFLRRAA